jgi:hypothetical protein
VRSAGVEDASGVFGSLSRHREEVVEGRLEFGPCAASCPTAVRGQDRDKVGTLSPDLQAVVHRPILRLWWRSVQQRVGWLHASRRRDRSAYVLDLSTRPNTQRLLSSRRESQAGSACVCSIDTSCLR